MARMREPSLSLHGIEGGAGAKTVIPAKVVGKFSIRYVSVLAMAIRRLRVFKAWCLLKQWKMLPPS